MRLAELIRTGIELFYIPPVAKIVPHKVFLYGVCGVGNMVLDAIFYFIIYHYVVCERFISLGMVVVSPHTAALVVVFPITFFNGFWLNRNVAFRSSHIKTHTQLMRYALSVVGSIIVSYVTLKFMVEVCHVWATPSKVASSFITALYSYIAARYFTFRE